MLSFSTCRFVLCFLSLSVSATLANTVRGARGLGSKRSTAKESSTPVNLLALNTADNYADPIPSQLTVSVSEMGTAYYTDAAGRVDADAARLNLKGGTRNTYTKKLTPSLYPFNADVSINGKIYLYGTGNSDVGVIQIGASFNLLLLLLVILWLVCAGCFACLKLAPPASNVIV
jgi:hypothetical protein